MNKEKLTETIITALAKHPYLWMFAICLFITPFFYGASDYIPAITPWFGAIAVLISVITYAVYKYKNDKLRLAIIILCSAIADFSAMTLYQHSQNKARWHFAGGAAILFILYHFADSKKYQSQLKSLLITGLGFCLKLYYVLITSVGYRQHDVYSFSDCCGHAGYIEYLLNNHHLPDFDVRDMWQFCHPPLHHIISAVWIYFNENILQSGHDQARESIQMLTLFYSGCIIISAYKILRHFKCDGISLFIPLMIISFHPAFILFSGSINNDTLSAAFVMGAVLCTLKWYQCQNMKNILKTALCVGLAMMTKISAATVAPPIALVFLIVFIKKSKNNWKQLILQFICFGLVCVPLGLWYNIRSYIKWEVPLTYVAEITNDDPQYLGDTPFIQRALDFSPKQFMSPYIQWDYPEECATSLYYNEYNPLIALMKNSLFGEFINEYNFEEVPYINVISFVFFCINVIIAGYALYNMIKMCMKKCTAEPTEKIFLVSFYVVMMLIFYKNAYDFPFTCTLNFRYITPTAIIGVIFIGLAIKGEYVKKPIIKVLYALTAAFSAAGTGVYLSLTW